MLDQKQLHQLWRDNPCWMFTGEEICELCNVSQHVVSRVKSLPDSPFFMNKCRPEWFLDWMRTHSSFQLTKAPEFTAKRQKVEAESDDDALAALHAKKITGLKPASRQRSDPRPKKASE
jgi:hypothetical protein